MIHKIGEKVGAVLKADKEGVLFLGYGKYEGEFFPEEAVGMFADVRRKIIKEKGESQKKFLTNPRIRLDSGKIVYGCECWWGNLEAVESYMKDWKKKGYKIINVDIEEYRKKVEKGIKKLKGGKK